MWEYVRAVRVAPFTGAWVEISESTIQLRPFLSLPSRERGLKLLGSVGRANDIWSLPSRERGLKLSQPDISNAGTRRSLHGSVG